MNALILAATLLCGAPPVADGSLLFLENSNCFVELYTRSEITHVAVVMNVDDTSWVYEATPGEVRRLTYEDYCSELGRLNKRRDADKKIRVWLARPARAYSQTEAAAMRGLLDEHLGRRYSIKGYVRGQSDGVHCAELAARTLCAASVLDLQRCQDESPATLLEKMKANSLPLATLHIEEPADEPERWYTVAWNDCLGYWSWCKWSGQEAWLWCW